MKEIENYPLVLTPVEFNKPFKMFNSSDAEGYLNWFNKTKDKRLEILKRHTGNYFSFDYSKESLKGLLLFLKDTIKSRDLSITEINKIKENIIPDLKEVIDIPNTTLSVLSVSICYDVAIYFGMTVLSSKPKLAWSYKIDSINNINYAQPVLLNENKNSKLELNPRRVIENIALDIIENKPLPDNKLITVCEYWLKLL